MVKGGQTYRILSDHLGSARLVVRADTGAVAQRIDYDAWGEILQDTSPGFQPFAFTGREYDAETGLYYYRARYYDPGVGRFISEDPQGFGAGVNFYSYVLNRPTQLVDPTGLDIAVIENGATEGNPIGHTAIAVTGAGVFSFGNGVPLGSSLAAYVVREAPDRNTRIYIIRTTPGQDAAALAYLRQFEDSWLPGGSSPSLPSLLAGLNLVDNCTVRANRALDAAQIDGEFSPRASRNQPRFLPGSAGVRAWPMSSSRIFVSLGTEVVPPELAEFEPTVSGASH